MKVALFDAEGAPVRLMVRELGADRDAWCIGQNLAWDLRYVGTTSRVLDGTPFADRASIMGLPTLGELDAALAEAGIAPQAFTPPETSPEDPDAG